MRCNLIFILLVAWLQAAVSGRNKHGGTPKHGNLNETSLKIATKIAYYDKHDVRIKNRNLIIYNLMDTQVHLNGLDVATNNVKIFISALQNHRDGADQEAFYLFNVIRGRENHLRNYLPANHPSVGLIDWLHVNDEMDLNMRTVKLLGLNIISSFRAVFFLSSDVRGPLVHRENGAWISQFRHLLDNNNVGMVGPILTCESVPHVSNFMFAWRSKLFTPLFEMENPQEHIGSSDFVRSSQYNISSVLYARKYRAPYFDGRCALGCGSKIQPTLNPISWCNVLPQDVIFTYWGGEPVRSLGYYCKHTLAVMRNVLANLATANPDLRLVVPETLVGGKLYEMYKQYNEELFMDRIRPKAVMLGHAEHIDVAFEAADLVETTPVVPAAKASNSNNANDDFVDVPPPHPTPEVASSSVAAANKKEKEDGNKHHKKSFQLFTSAHNNKGHAKANTSSSTTSLAQYENTEVCFAVRTAFMHDSAEEIQSKTMFEDVDIDGFILSLLRQTNPLWVAYFFVTDTNPFDDRLLEILDKYQDPRLVYTPIPKKYKIPFTTEDAGYTATDYVMKRIVNRKQCRWISATNADNVYGSAVVQKVLNVKAQAISSKIPDMLLNAIDSRNFMWADYIERRDLTKGLGVEQTWTDYCTGLEAALLFNSYTYTVQPSPELGKVDLASVFYSREKYATSGMSFGNFTNGRLYPCLGCQDGYLTQYLVRDLHWTYSRLSIDGLKSIIFHGPSPTLCIASGNVWFDYPSVNRVGCISQQTVRMLSYHNPKYYDWMHLNFKSNKICLRLSRTGFFSETGH